MLGTTAVALAAVLLTTGALALSGVALRPSAPSDPAGAAPGPSTASSTGSEAPRVPDVLDGVALDALQQQRLGELRDFTAWLEEAGAGGFIGEVGWPAGDADWDGLGELWYRLAEQEGLWTAAWAAGSHWTDDYRLLAYGDGGSGSLDTASGQALILEELETTRSASGEADDDEAARHGVNLAGLEFGTGEAFTSTAPGLLGTDYFAEPAASYAWLADRGVDLVRLPVRWERLQPALGEPFDAAASATVTEQLDAAAAAGVEVILDLHNYGEYRAAEGRLLLGSEALPGERLAEVWLRIAETWGAHPALLGYGLMNEPNDLGGGGERGAAEAWEAITQQAVTTLREAGDEHLLLIAGYDWSSLARWRGTHPSGWIDDPADRFRYEAHHYWDAHGEGVYPLAYADELAGAIGFAAGEAGLALSIGGIVQTC